MCGHYDNAISGIIQYRGDRMDCAEQNVHELFLGAQAQAQQNGNQFIHNMTSGGLKAWIDNQKQEHNGGISGRLKTKGVSMFGELAQDIRSFIREHKSIIYWCVILYLLDHWFFNGAFKDKLKASMEKLVGKVEHKVHEALK